MRRSNCLRNMALVLPALMLFQRLPLSVPGITLGAHPTSAGRAQRHPAARLRLRGGGSDESLQTVSDVAGLVSTIFFSSSGGADNDMDLPQVLPVSDIASRSLDRDYLDFMQDPYMPPLIGEWDSDLPLTGRQVQLLIARARVLYLSPSCMHPYSTACTYNFLYIKIETQLVPSTRTSRRCARPSPRAPSHHQNTRRPRQIASRLCAFCA